MRILLGRQLVGEGVAVIRRCGLEGGGSRSERRRAAAVEWRRRDSGEFLNHGSEIGGVSGQHGGGVAAGGPRSLPWVARRRLHTVVAFSRGLERAGVGEGGVRRGRVRVGSHGWCGSGPAGLARVLEMDVVGKWVEQRRRWRGGNGAEMGLSGRVDESGIGGA